MAVLEECKALRESRFCSGLDALALGVRRACWNARTASASISELETLGSVCKEDKLYTPGMVVSNWLFM